MPNDNEIAPVFGGDVSMPSSSALAGALKESAVKDPRGGALDGADYLNFSGKRGMFTSGADGKPFDMESTLVPNIAGFQDGWVCWKNGQPVATRLANITGAPVPTPDFNEFAPFENDADGWFQAKAAMFKDVDDGAQYFFKINSVSGVSALAGLIGLIADRAERGDPAWPVLQLGVDEFQAKGYKNYKPEFNILGWLSDENVGRVFSEEEVDLDELMADGSAPAAIPSQGKEEPKRRRRRSQA